MNVRRGVLYVGYALAFFAVAYAGVWLSQHYPHVLAGGILFFLLAGAFVLGAKVQP